MLHWWMTDREIKGVLFGEIALDIYFSKAKMRYANVTENGKTCNRIVELPYCLDANLNLNAASKSLHGPISANAIMIERSGSYTFLPKVRARKIGNHIGIYAAYGHAYIKYSITE